MSTNRLQKTLWVALIAVIALGLVFGGAYAKGKPPKKKPTPPIFTSHPQQNAHSGPAQPVTPGGRPLYAVLTGLNVITGPGDPDGTGTIKLRLNQGQGTICFEIGVSNIMTPTATNIYSGTTGINGGLLVTLSAPVNGVAIGCATASKDMIKSIRKSPDLYYVDVVTTDYPAGALRGQLSKFR